MSALKPWFCFDGDMHHYFETELEALSEAERAIRFYLDESWDESVTDVMVGKVTHTTKRTNVKPRPDDTEIDEHNLDLDGNYWDDNHAYHCSYEALPVSL